MNLRLTLAAVLTLFSSPLLGQYSWGTVSVLKPSDIWQNDQTPPDLPFFYDRDKGLSYYCVGHKTEHACVRWLYMEGLPDNDWTPNPNVACCHIKSGHTDPDFLSKGDFFRIGGFLSDPRNPDLRLKTIFVGNGLNDPTILPWV
jgi:hypothetical protein